MEILLENIKNNITLVNFELKDRLLYIDYDNKYVLISVQKSAFDNAFYINVGVYFYLFKKPLKIPPSIGQWHFEFRYGELLKDINKSTDPNVHLPLEFDEKSLQIVINNINNIILPKIFEIFKYSYLKINYPNLGISNLMLLRTSNLEFKKHIDCEGG